MLIFLCYCLISSFLLTLRITVISYRVLPWVVAHCYRVMLWQEVQDGLNYTVWHLRGNTLIVVNSGAEVFKVSSCLSSSTSCVYFAHCVSDNCTTWGKIEAGTFVPIHNFHSCQEYSGLRSLRRAGIMRRSGRIIEEWMSCLLFTLWFCK